MNINPVIKFFDFNKSDQQDLPLCDKQLITNNVSPNNNSENNINDIQNGQSSTVIITLSRPTDYSSTEAILKNRKYYSFKVFASRLKEPEPTFRCHCAIEDNDCDNCEDCREVNEETPDQLESFQESNMEKPKRSLVEIPETRSGRKIKKPKLLDL